MNNTVDIDKIKRSWQSLSDASLKKDVTKAEIEKIMRKKSKNELKKLLNTFIIETIVSIPIIILIWIWLNHEVEGYFWIFEVFMAIVLVLVVFPIFKMFRIGKFHNCATVDYLTRFINTFEFVVKSILRRSRWLLAFAGPVGILSGALKDGCTFDSKGIMIFLIAIALYIPFYFGLWFFMKWYYRVAYIRRVDRLKEYLNELQEEVDDLNETTEG